ncbi:MAG: RtcB family protein [Cyanobacteria bacterium]|nr:RtcB family protein [Cyanobacteriota bacterium]
MKQVIDLGHYPVKVWTDHIEPEALKQLINVSSMPFIHKHIAVMPDVHSGIGATIGSVIPTIGAVIPAAVGVDIGCGMCAVPTSLFANDLPDTLKTIRLDIEKAIPVGFSAYQDADHLSDEDQALFHQEHVNQLLEKYGIKTGKQAPEQQLGTLGGGNHFIEICLDESDQVWIMLHSGSRGIGNRIGTRFIELAKEYMTRHFINLPDRDLAYLSEGALHFDDYVIAVEWAQRYAAMNRKIMLRRIVNVLKHHFPTMTVDLESRAVNCHHNYISRENHFGQNCIVTRKGAVRARKGDLGIIPGSMGTRSYIVEGLGNPESFYSCSHGAGRRMSRTKAKATFSIEDHIKATQGVECRKDKDVIDETPQAYKDIDEVMENQKELVRPLHTLRQVICVKG